MSANSNPPPLEKTHSAANAIASTLVQVAGLAAGLAVIGLYIGWRELTSYYATLGAPWVVEMLPPSRLIQKGAGLLSVIAIAALFSVYALTQATASAVGLRRLSIAVAILGCSLLGVATFFRNDLEGPGLRTRYIERFTLDG